MKQCGFLFGLGLDVLIIAHLDFDIFLNDAWIFFHRGDFFSLLMVSTHICLVIYPASFLRTEKTSHGFTPAESMSSALKNVRPWQS